MQSGFEKSYVLVCKAGIKGFIMHHQGVLDMKQQVGL